MTDISDVAQAGAQAIAEELEEGGAEYEAVIVLVGSSDTNGIGAVVQDRGDTEPLKETLALLLGAAEQVAERAGVRFSVMNVPMGEG